MVACENLPTSEACLKVLCELNAYQNATKDGNITALHIAISRKPDLEVVKWLVRSGTHVKQTACKDYLNTMMFLFRPSECGVHFAHYDSYSLSGRISSLSVHETEVADVAKYLAKHGCVKNALRAVLHSEKGMLSPQLLEEVVDYFLEKGALLNTNSTSNVDCPYRPTILALFAKKSIIFLEGLQMSLKKESKPCQKYSTVTILIIQGMVSGNISLSVVQEIHDILPSELRERLPPNFRLLESLYSMTQNPPSLSQLTRTTIRKQMSKCKQFSRENLRKLPLPESLEAFVQLADLGDESKVENMMEGAEDVLKTNTCHG